MGIFFCGHTALNIWRATRLSAARFSASCAKPTTSALDPEACVASAAALGLRSKAKLDVLVSAPQARRVSSKLRYHVCAADMPDRSFMKVQKGVYLPSPELLFLQMATELPLIRLIELGFELCGTYSLAEDESQGFFSSPTLTNKAKIISYLDKCNSIKGVKAARLAVKYLINESASPMETALTMVLCLPPSLGGYGFPDAELNREMRLSLTNAEGIESFRAVRCDLAWPEYSMAIEYESDQEHLSSQKFARDSIRRNDLTAANVTVLTVTKRQLLNRAHWPNLAGRIAEVMKRRLAIRSKNHVDAQRELYAQLLGKTFHD